MTEELITMTQKKQLVRSEIPGKRSYNEGEGSGDAGDASGGSAGSGDISLVPIDSGDFDRQLRMTEKGVTDGALEQGFAKDKTARSYDPEKKQSLQGEVSVANGIEEHPIVKPTGVTPKNLEHSASENTASLDELEAKPENELSPELRYALQQQLTQKKEKKFNPTPSPLA